ncbi:putative membrane protein [Salmonella enterica subsp. enterica serovar Gallinarum/Pullorum str. FCAV198]|nr:putative membrane protein [Salmonella enterica subsp. enterica serovar Gallinarum/Pullorum str. FCAV198]
MQHDAIQRRSLPERIFHAVCFEGIATAILALTTAWLMQRSVLESIMSRGDVYVKEIYRKK